MKLQLILEAVDRRSAVPAITDYASQLALVLKGAVSAARDAAKTADTPRTVKGAAGKRLARWFNDNYFNGFERTLRALGSREVDQALGRVTVHGSRAEREESGITASGTLLTLINTLPAALRKATPELGRAADVLSRAADEFIRDMEQITKSMQQSDEDEPTQKLPRREEGPDARGQQADQAEGIINSVLANLPRDIAGDIRNEIRRSSNRLQALQAALQKRNIRP